MMKLLTASASLALVLATACSKSSDNSSKAAKPAPTPTTGDSKPAEPEPVPEPRTEADSSIAPVLAEYESIRSLLANDKGDGIAAHANAIKKHAGSVAVSAAAKPHLEGLATAAGELASVEPTDFDALRLAFGEVSKHLVAAIEAEPALGEGLHTFECPMAKGYKLWLQPNAELENPYMGQKMLRCGAEVTPG